MDIIGIQNLMERVGFNGLQWEIWWIDSSSWQCLNLLEINSINHPHFRAPWAPWAQGLGPCTPSRCKLPPSWRRRGSFHTPPGHEMGRIKLFIFGGRWIKPKCSTMVNTK